MDDTFTDRRAPGTASVCIENMKAIAVMEREIIHSQQQRSEMMVILNEIKTQVYKTNGRVNEHDHAIAAIQSTTAETSEQLASISEIVEVIKNNKKHLAQLIGWIGTAATLIMPLIYTLFQHALTKFVP